MDTPIVNRCAPVTTFCPYGAMRLDSGPKTLHFQGMCGRFDFHGDPADVQSLLQLTLPGMKLSGRYNTAPTHVTAVIHLQGNDLVVSPMSFGWRRRPPQAGMLINARAETAAQKPTFRGAFRGRRCVILAHGFYEWQKGPAPRQPWYFRPKDGQVFGLAGLWQASDSPTVSAGDAPAREFVVMTTAANATVATLHDRMPVMLPLTLVAAFLRGDPPMAADLCRPWPPETMQGYPVSRTMNNADNDAPSCIEPLSA